MHPAWLCSRWLDLRGCLKSLHGFLQRYPHAMVIVDFRELRTIVTSSEAALHQLKTLMSGLFKQPLRGILARCTHAHVPYVHGDIFPPLQRGLADGRGIGYRRRGLGTS